MPVKALIILVLGVGIILSQSSRHAFAQNSRPAKPITIKNTDRRSPFLEGRTAVAEVIYDGLDAELGSYVGDSYPIYTNDFLKLLRESRADISEGEAFQLLKVEKVLKLLKEWLANRGYLKAEVVALGRKLPMNKMQLIFSVQRGLPVFVTDIRFEGTNAISEAELINEFSRCIGGRPPIFERKLYEYCSQRHARFVIFSHGFFKAKIGPPVKKLLESGYTVTFIVKEEARYRIGKIDVEGNQVLNKAEILVIIGQEEGDIADGRNLRDAIYERLKRAYLDKGYLQFNSAFDVDFVEPQAEGLDGIVNVQIAIEEGREFKTGWIEVFGAKPETAKSLRQLIKLEDGKIFCQRDFENGIKKIDETHDYLKIDIDSDVELRLDEENAVVHAIIKLIPIPK